VNRRESAVEIVGSSDEQGLPQASEARRPVVVLAEDNDDARRVYGLVLRHFGYHVEEACTGHEAVRLARTVHPNLVLMDIGLPGLDGWQASRVLKADPITRGIPLVAFSARVDSSADLGERASFDGFIRKPVSPSDLARRVGAYLELVEPSSQLAESPTATPRPTSS
jgi:two-component system cell cycle response regulator DivK